MKPGSVGTRTTCSRCAVQPTRFHLTDPHHDAIQRAVCLTSCRDWYATAAHELPTQVRCSFMLNLSWQVALEGEINHKLKDRGRILVPNLLAQSGSQTWHSSHIGRGSGGQPALIHSLGKGCERVGSHDCQIKSCCLRLRIFCSNPARALNPGNARFEPSWDCNPK